MPLYAFYADRPEKMRHDGANFAMANGANEAAARAACEALIDADLSGFTAVVVDGSTPPVVVQGYPPVGGRVQTTWPTQGRAGARLAGD